MNYWWNGFKFIIRKMKTNDLKSTILDKEKIEKNNKLLAQFIDLAILEERANLRLEIEELFELTLWDELNKLKKNFVLEVEKELRTEPAFILAINNYKQVTDDLSKAIRAKDFSLASNLRTTELEIHESLLSLWAKYYLNLASNHGLLSENISDEETIENYLRSYVKED